MSNKPDDAIAELTEYDQWVAWDVRKGRKIPINPMTQGHPASVDDPLTWNSFERAIACERANDFAGRGFVFTEDDPFIGIDLDNVVDPETGEIDDWAREVLDKCDSYTEYSPSGEGIHVIARGSIERAHKDSKRGIEIYDQKRFFCVTADRIDRYSKLAEDCGPALGWMIDEYFEGIDERDEEELELTGIDDDYAFALDAEDWLHDALDEIDADCPYPEWIKVGMALHQHFDGGEEGLDLWDRWSQGGTKYEGRQDLLHHWRSFGDHPSERTLKTIWYLAEQYGWHYESDASFESLRQIKEQMEPQELPDEVDEIQIDDMWTGFTEGYEDRSEFPDFLIEPSVLGEGDLCLVFGPPKSHKTMSVLSLCRQLGKGDQWMGLQPQRKLKIAYLNLEMKRERLRERSHLTWMSDKELDKLRGQFFYSKRYAERLSEETFKDLQDRMQSVGQDLDLFVVDPAVNFFSGESENDNVEVSRFIKGVRALSEWVGDESTATMLVHHTSKAIDGDASPFQAIRGASAYRGAYDSAFFLQGYGEADHKIQVRSEIRNGDGVDDWRMRFAPSLGRFVSPVYDEGLLKPFNDVQKKRADQLLSKLRSYGRKGESYSFRKLAEHIDEDGWSHWKSWRWNLKYLHHLARKKVLALFDPGDYGGERLHHNSHGHVCCKGMEFKGERVWPHKYIAPLNGQGIAEGSSEPIPVDDRWWATADPEEDGPYAGFAEPSEFHMEPDEDAFANFS